MALISLSKIQNVLPEFIDTRMMPVAPSNVKWLLGGATFLMLGQADTLIGKYLPMLKALNLVNDNNQLDIELAKGFINSAFSKSETLSFYGFTFNPHDGEALLAILEKYKDDAQ